MYNPIATADGFVNVDFVAIELITSFVTHSGRAIEIGRMEGRCMKTLFPPLLGCLLVVLVLFTLISKDQTSSSGSGLTIVGEGVSDFGEGLMHALLLRHQHQSASATANREIVKAQRLLKNYGYYSGPVDGAMNQRTREALRSFQESRQLTITGIIDSETAQELGLSKNTDKS